MCAGPTPFELDDVFAQVGLEHADAGGLQGMVQADLLGRHALGLDRQLHPMPRGDVEQDAPGFLGIPRPVHLAARPGDRPLGLLQIVIEVRDGVQADIVAGLAQLLPVLVAEGIHQGRPVAQELGGGLLHRRGHLRRDLLGVAAEVDRGRHLAHDAPLPAVRISIRCMARIGEPA